MLYSNYSCFIADGNMTFPVNAMSVNLLKDAVDFASVTVENDVMDVSSFDLLQYGPVVAIGSIQLVD